MIVTVYTDASHCMRTKIAACSFIAMCEMKIDKHRVTLIDKCFKSAAAEIYAAIYALQYCFLKQGVTEIILYTDYEPIVHLRTNRRAKHEYDFYNELIDTVNIIREYGVFLEIKHVKAHSTNKMNNIVDQSSRQQLRKYLKFKKRKLINNEKNHHRDSLLSSNVNLL